MHGSGDSSRQDQPRIVELLARLEAFARDRTGGDSPFNRGCSEDEIRHMEKVIRTPLPDDYKELLRHANGQPDDSELVFPPDQLAFLSAEEVVELWQGHRELPDDEFFDELTYEDKVRCVPFHPARIPIAQYEDGGAYLWIDNVPGPAGRSGQLIFNVDEIDFAVVEESVTELFRRYVSLLDTGAAALTEVPSDYGEGYWFTASGRYLDFAVYDELRRPSSP
ncbi:SMI1/KNR4 family protein [Streptomyces sp. XD-27]|uniref:SMI1/KNR4 family protein n=1 Tax=Streptomyces sp. XD-27 TaxID=3062779 RepID=UPI0026F446E7|nr:SMI1/KNR4 family protein [Streptomyces sp. XD-27]WKX68912.1 SMI1/KNR4 family protein [Streptomyces sp. XD-27]